MRLLKNYIVSQHRYPNYYLRFRLVFCIPVLNPQLHANPGFKKSYGISGKNSIIIVTIDIIVVKPHEYMQYHKNFLYIPTFEWPKDFVELQKSLLSLLSSLYYADIRLNLVSSYYLNVIDISMHMTFNQKNDARNVNCMIRAVKKLINYIKIFYR